MNIYNIRKELYGGKSINDLKLRVVYYARVSTDKDEQLHSLSSQVSFFNDYISKNKNWIFIDSYVDEGISGTHVNKRENFLRMIDDSKKDKFDIILTKEISRFSRNTLDSIRYTQELLNNGVGVIFLNDNINTILPDSELRLTIMASVAQDEVRKLSDRVSFGMKRGIDSGVVYGCSNIYGYEKKDGSLIIDENQAKIVRLIYEKYANDVGGAGSVTRYINNLGYRNNVGKEFQTNTILRILKNPKYKGYYCGNKSKVIDYISKKKIYLPSDNWIMYEDHKNVPPIVSEELWDRVQLKLKLRKVDCFKDNKYSYSSKIICNIHDCYYHRYGNGYRKNNPVWECKEYRLKGTCGCNNPRLNNYELDCFFKKLFKDIIINNNIIDLFLSEYNGFINKYKCLNESNDILNKINSIKMKKDKLLNFLLNDVINDEEYNLQLDKLNKEFVLYQNKMKNVSNKSNFMFNKLYLYNCLNDMLDDEEVFKSIINLIVSKIVVFNNNGIDNVLFKVFLNSNNYINVYSNNHGKELYVN